MTVLIPINGKNTVIPASKNGKKAPSFRTLIARRMGQPITEVFLTMKDMVRAATMSTTFLSNLFFTCK